MENSSVTKDQYVSAPCFLAAGHMEYSGPPLYLTLCRKRFNTEDKGVQQEFHRTTPPWRAVDFQASACPLEISRITKPCGRVSDLSVPISPEFWSDCLCQPPFLWKHCSNHGPKHYADKPLFSVLAVHWDLQMPESHPSLSPHLIYRTTTLTAQV